jgi:hypothetical protein
MLKLLKAVFHWIVERLKWPPPPEEEDEEDNHVWTHTW